MRVLLCLLAASFACAIDDEGRARKQPIVVDAIGNTLPPPSKVPATVGSPVNLLTPDRYEFYTFDESGELVKKLMTLEEIQAIVAAGEEAEGLVTLASDNQPTMPFNITQPSYNKVHSVVTNVQNVLKAQMEAHKNNPMLQPTLDTPDVSDSWSLILPSIFGNTGLDIVPDKIPTNISPPETDTLEFQPDIDTDDSFSKEGNNEIVSSSTPTTTHHTDSVKYVPTTDNALTQLEELKTTPATSTTSTTSTTTTTTTTMLPITTTRASSTTPKVFSTSTTRDPPTTTTRAALSTTSTTTTTNPTPTTKVTSTAKPLTTKPSKITTVKDFFIKITPLKETPSKATSSVKPSTKPLYLKTTPATTKQTTTVTTPSTTTKKRPLPSTTNRPTDTTTVKSRITSTTQKPTTKTFVKITSKVTTSKPFTTKKQPVPLATTPKDVESNMNRIQLITNDIVTEKNNLSDGENNTFIPISTVTYITERTTQKQQPPKKATIITSTTQKVFTTTTVVPISTSQKAPLEVTTYKPATSTLKDVLSTVQNINLEKFNTTTVTTQSVSPSTTMSTTELIFTVNTKPVEHSLSNDSIESAVPLFDVAQSISQIASDLGGNYISLPTVSNILDTTKINAMDLESKENVEIDILPDNDPNLNKSNVSDANNDNFVKISTIDPHNQSMDKFDSDKVTTKVTNVMQSETTEMNTMAPIESTTIDKILSESMGDLLFQIVNQAPQSIMESASNSTTEIKVATTEATVGSTTSDNLSNLLPSTLKPTTEIVVIAEKGQSSNDIPIIGNRISEITSSIISETGILPSVIKKPDSIETPLNKEDNKIYKPDFTEKLPSIQDNKTYVQISMSNEKDSTLESFTEKHTTQNTPENISSTTKVSTVKEDFIVLNSLYSKEPIKTETTTMKLSVETTNTEIDNMEIDKENDNNSTNSDASNHIKNNALPKLPSDDNPKIEEFKKKIQKVNIDDKELINDRNNSWKLISTMTPPKSNEMTKDKIKNAGDPNDSNSNKDIVLDFSKENQGLEVTTKDLEEDISKFTELCNELAFRYWNTIVETIDKRRSFVLSPYSITSMLAMMFMGARGATSGEMNDILKLDDMVTFNPHFTLKNISDSIETTPESGVAISAFIRELYSDRTKGKILTFYKERAQQFYNGHVEEVNFKLISDIIRRRTNLLVKRYTWGKIAEYMKANSITMNPPLAAFSTNIFQTDCTGSSVEGRDGEMYFVVSPNVRQRRLVPVPAVVYRSGFLAGYDPVLDATAAALGNTNSIVSTLFVMPGQQGNVVHAEDLEALEQRLLDANPTTPAWNRLLRTLLPRIGLELQIPRFSHKSTFNISYTLRNMGLKDLFDAEHADLGGLNGPSKDLYLSDMIQTSTFVTCGESIVGEQHHMEDYPEAQGIASRRRSSRWVSDWDEPRDYQRAFHDPHDVGEAMHLPLHLRPRQARLPARNAQPARLKFDRPFLYFVRHNPTGMILYVGRYNPRLLP